ncbi:MAG TPA: FkbM family methyltransferase [Bacteroidia bacterium]|nr:FkbM family methyltransferase [Bacteroidia bacterium]
MFKWMPLEYILQKLTSGKYFGHWITKVPPNPYQYKENSKRFVKRNGINYELDLSDMVDWYIFWDFQQRERNYLYSLIKSGDLILDIGSNMGEVCLNFAKRSGANGTVYSFEPHPLNYKRLQKNLSLNPELKVFTYQNGFGDHKASYRMSTVDNHNKGMNRIRENGEIPVEIITLDEFVENQKLKEINLIKIDTEGFEFNVLKGSVNTIKNYKPKLFIELDDRNLKEQNSSAKQLVSFLIHQNYSIIKASDQSAITVETEMHNCQWDILAYSKA